MDPSMGPGFWSGRSWKLINPPILGLNKTGTYLPFFFNNTSTSKFLKSLYLAFSFISAAVIPRSPSPSSKRILIIMESIFVLPPKPSLLVLVIFWMDSNEMAGVVLNSGSFTQLNMSSVKERVKQNKKLLLDIQFVN